MKDVNKYQIKYRIFLLYLEIIRKNSTTEANILYTAIIFPLLFEFVAEFDSLYIAPKTVL